MQEIILTSPCDLYGRNATNFHHYIQSLNILVWIEKLKENRKVDCSSLVGILSLGVIKHDTIKIYVNDDKYSNSIIQYLQDLK